jgi:hypothetical protein
MSYAADLTADLAIWIAGLLREMLTNAPPPTQRNTAEWLNPVTSSGEVATDDEPLSMLNEEPPL